MFPFSPHTGLYNSGQSHRGFKSFTGYCSLGGDGFIKDISVCGPDDCIGGIGFGISSFEGRAGAGALVGFELLSHGQKPSQDLSTPLKKTIHFCN